MTWPKRGETPFSLNLSKWHCIKIKVYLVFKANTIIMQKINATYVTNQIIWGLKPPFSLNSVHSVQPIFSITGSNSCRRRRTLWRRLYFIQQGTQHLFWWHWRYAQSIMNWGRGSKKLLGCTKQWNRVSSGWEIVTNAYMTIFPRKNFYCSRELANQRAALDRCWTTQRFQR